MSLSFLRKSNCKNGNKNVQNMPICFEKNKNIMLHITEFSKTNHGIHIGFKHEEILKNDVLKSKLRHDPIHGPSHGQI